MTDQTNRRSLPPLLTRRRGRASALLLGGVVAGFVTGATLRPAAGRPAPVEAGLGEAMAHETTQPKSAAEQALGFAVTIEGDGIYGSGVLLVPAAGLVVTAGHVIDEMHHPEVSFSDGAVFPAKVLERDRGLDLALLEIAPQPGRPAPVIGDPLALRPGEEVLAVGCPRRLPFSVSRGIVSYVGRSIDGARWLQTDIPINDGNSGGPVVDKAGRLVAVTSFIVRRAQGLSFALPIHYALERFTRVGGLFGSAEDLPRFRRWRGPLPGASVAATATASAAPTPQHP